MKFILLLTSIVYSSIGFSQSKTSVNIEEIYSLLNLEGLFFEDLGSQTPPKTFIYKENESSHKVFQRLDKRQFRSNKFRSGLKSDEKGLLKLISHRLKKQNFTLVDKDKNHQHATFTQNTGNYKTVIKVSLKQKYGLMTFTSAIIDINNDPIFEDKYCTESSFLGPKILEQLDTLIISNCNSANCDKNFIESKEIILQPKIDFFYSCISNGIKVYCLEEIKKKDTVINIVTDTIKNKNYELFVFKKSIISIEQKQEEREVLCDSQISEIGLKRIKEKLISKGVLKKNLNSRSHLLHILKNALMTYQKNNYLHQSGFDVQTLTSLGFNIEDLIIVSSNN